jgi:preprotein translocase subunit SecD
MSQKLTREQYQASVFISKISKKLGVSPDFLLKEWNTSDSGAKKSEKKVFQRKPRKEDRPAGDLRSPPEAGERKKNVVKISLAEIRNRPSLRYPGLGAKKWSKMSKQQKKDYLDWDLDNYKSQDPRLRKEVDEDSSEDEF